MNKGEESSIYPAFPNPRGGFSNTEELWLIHAKGMKTLQHHHLVNPNKIIILANDYQYLLKLLGEMLIGNFRIDGSS